MRCQLAGDTWGIALLHELLAVVYAAVKEAKPDALVITHTPHPGFVDVTDMIRLNDMLRLDDPGPLPHGAAADATIARAVAARGVPGAADRHGRLVRSRTSRPGASTSTMKTDLGVPSLYYATQLDLTGEALDDGRLRGASRDAGSDGGAR